MKRADPRGIAKGLTKAQRDSILSATDLMSNHGGYPYLTVRHTGEPWPMGIATFLTLKTDRLSPLGLAVRAILENEQ
jgi:hypothetical protein